MNNIIKYEVQLPESFHPKSGYVHISKRKQEQSEDRTCNQNQAIGNSPRMLFIKPSTRLRKRQEARKTQLGEDGGGGSGKCSPTENPRKSGERFSYGIHSGVCAAGIFSFSFNFLFPMYALSGPRKHVCGSVCVRVSVCVKIWPWQTAVCAGIGEGAGLGFGRRRQPADNNSS